jgi:hypothetical protein
MDAMQFTGIAMASEEDMSKYDKEIDSSRREYDKAIEPLERETHEVREVPPPRESQRDDGDREDDRKPR